MAVIQSILGANLTFAVKRWPIARDWSALLRTADLGHAQFCFDLEDPLRTGDSRVFREIRAEAETHGVIITSAFTGMAVYNHNLLAHPDPSHRRWALDWYRRACAAAVALGASAVGGHMGAVSVADSSSQATRRERIDDLLTSVVEVSRTAAEVGLEALLWEVMPVAREYPATFDEVDEMLEECDRRTALPVELCIDLGHACRAGASVTERDPMAWLDRYLDRCRSVHLQQTDGYRDRHWAFTEDTDIEGIIDPAAVSSLVSRSTRSQVEMMLEPIPAPEEPDSVVAEWVVSSANRWREALAAASRTSGED